MSLENAKMPNLKDKIEAQAVINEGVVEKEKRVASKVVKKKK